jgi:hypothetical protein
MSENSNISLTQIFLNKIKEELSNNKSDIEVNIVKPILDNIFCNISHYLYFIFIILLLILLLIVINIIFLIYYSKLILKKQTMN